MTLPFDQGALEKSLSIAPFVQKVDSAARWINLSPVDSAIGFPNTYPLDNDLSSDSAIQRLNKRGKG